MKVIDGLFAECVNSLVITPDHITMLRKKVALVQPTFRKMDGKPVKGFTLGSCPLELPLLSSAVPADWEKTATHEYFDEIDYATDASVVFIMSSTNDILHGREVAERFKALGKTVIFGAHEDAWSEQVLGEVCDAFYHGTPGPTGIRRILDDVQAGTLQRCYEFGHDFNHPFDYSIYKDKKIRFLHVQASGGCLFKCEYCRHPWASNGGKPAYRDIDVIIQDLKAVRKITRYAAFKDPNFYNSREHLIKLCTRMVKEDIGLYWGAQMPIYVGGDEEVLKLMYKAGCRVVYIGFESMQQAVLDEVRKPFDVKKYLSLVEKIHKAGIYVVGYFMVGFDHDTPDSFEMIYSFVKESRIAYPLVNVLMPVPGTPVFDRLRAEGRLDIPDAETFMKVKPLYGIPCNRTYYEPKNMSRAELEDRYMRLLERLASFPDILRRSFAHPSWLSFEMLKMNLAFRKDYLRMVDDHKARQAMFARKGAGKVMPEPEAALAEPY